MRIIDFFDRAVALYPGNAFLKQGNVTRQYSQTAAISHRIAAALQRERIPVSAAIGFYMPNDWRGVEAMYGAFRAGNPIAPVNSRNPVAQNIVLLAKVRAEVPDTRSRADARQSGALAAAVSGPDDCDRRPC